jgi:hypothetical protein
VCLGGGFEIDVSAAAIMKRFEQISDESSIGTVVAGSMHLRRRDPTTSVPCLLEVI